MNQGQAQIHKICILSNELKHAYIPLKAVQTTVADPGFSLGGFARAPKVVLFHNFFAKNCMETKEFGPPGTHIPGTPWIHQ